MKLVILLLVGVVAVFVGLIVAAASFVGCVGFHMNRTAGSGHLIATNLNLTGFQSVEAGGTFVVNVKQGDACSVSVTSDDNLLDKLSVTQSGGWVHFDIKSGENISPTALHAEVTVPTLQAVSASGASQIVFSPFKMDKFSADASGASRIEGAIDAGSAHAECSGASHISLTGNASNADLNGSGASGLDCGGLMANQADVGLSGASKASIRATEKLSYDLSGASRLTYAGAPQIGNNGCSGAASVHQQ